MNLIVITPCFYSDTTPCMRLIESCLRNRLNLRLYGVGEPFTTLADVKITRLMLELEKLTAKYVLLTDGNDSFVMADENEILNKYSQSKAYILVSADRQQEPLDSRYPYCIFRDHYPKSDTPWRYCNSGGYIGLRTSLLHMLRRMQTLEWNDYTKNYVPVYREVDWQNDQFRMSLAYLLGFPLTVDINCELFQTMGCSQDGEIVWTPRLNNLVTKTTPGIVHYNGLMPGLEEAYEQCYGAVHA